MTFEQSKEELIKKYWLAGRIRFMTFAMLLAFLFLLKSIGGYAYLKPLFIVLIFVEAIINQPYGFYLRHVDIYRFQYYQMTTDIIAISWVLHYMGGLEAPIVNVAYYAVILWAGVVSSAQAVFFAVTVSTLFFSAIVVLGHYEILPYIFDYNYKMSASQMFSLLLGNVSFFFAFGYFCVRSSRVIKTLERTRHEESLRNIHKHVATGYLMGDTAHDVLNYLTSIRGYTTILSEKINKDDEVRQMIDAIERLDMQSADLLNRLAKFSRYSNKECALTDINRVIEDALGLTWPLVKYTLTIKKDLEPHLPSLMAVKDQLQEVFVILILNALDAVPGKGTLSITTVYDKKEGNVVIKVSDTGKGIKREDLKKIGEPFFTTKGEGKGAGLGLATAYGIIERHNGTISVESTPGKGTTFTIKLPIAPGEGTAA